MVTYDDYAFTKYPPYALGGAYVLSRAAFHQIHLASFFTKYLFIDDVWVGIIAKKIGIEAIHSPDFTVNGRAPYNGPESYRNLIASTDFPDPEEMKSIWEVVIKEVNFKFNDCIDYW